ncbi:hypothetical protein NST23_15025 [Brevibacillus sp. FSL K6-0770]|uniref:hypothetical protein n=1 Tax=Brevibacillus sp. FSL K6-0770 TaxID=2954673 RepID=UPI0030F615CB
MATDQVHGNGWVLARQPPTKKRLRLGIGQNFCLRFVAQQKLNALVHDIAKSDFCLPMFIATQTQKEKP